MAGGLNNVSAGYGAIGGGQDNQAGAYAGVLGGLTNKATGNYSAIGGGQNNAAAGAHTNLGGGQGNSVIGTHGVIGGGQSNTTTTNASHATIGGGQGNSVTGAHGVIGGGQSNTIAANASHATIGGGQGHSASANFSTVIGGSYASASRHGQVAQAAGRFAATGDAQRSQYVMRGSVTGAGPFQIGLAGFLNEAQIDVPDNQAIMAHVLVVARNQAGQAFGKEARCLINNEGNVITGACTETPIFNNIPGFNVTVALATGESNKGLWVVASGAASPVRIVATVTTAEVSFP